MTTPNPAVGKVSNPLAALMTMMLPGLGQLMQGRIMPGILWALLVGFNYLAFLWIGIGAHVLCILDAYLARQDAPTNWQEKLLPAAGVLLLAGYVVFRNL